MRRKDRIAVATTGLLVVCAVVLTAVNVRGAYRRAHRLPTAPRAIVPDWRSYAAAGHRFGPVAAKVTVVVFVDYQCPACRSMARRLDAVLEEHPTSVAAVIRHYPLESHPHAAAAARAAECASVQGQFKPFHDLLLADADRLGQKPWAEYAREAGVADTVAFAECLRGSRAAAIVDADVEAARRLGVSATPTWLLDEEEYVGDVWDFSRLIERHLHRTANTD